MTAITLEHEDPRAARVTLVDWTLGNRCNYACSYCPAALHDGSEAWQPYEAVAAFAARVIDHYAALGQSLLFQFTGGEPTLCRYLPELTDLVRARGARVGIISNGSRSAAWWTSFRDHLDQIVLSHHLEHVDLARFIEVARVVSDTVTTHVNVTMLPARFDECLANACAIRDSGAPVGVTLKALRDGFGARVLDYTPAQRAALDAPWPSKARRPRDLVGRGRMRLTDADGASASLRANELIVRGLNAWQSWRCAAGFETLAVDARGYVYRGVCGQGGSLGRITDADLTLPTGETVCGFARCKCASDITVTKRAPPR